MRLAVLFSVFVAGAYPQTVDVRLPARNIFTLSLTSDAPQLTKSFSVDAAANVDISVMSTSASLAVSLIDPAGNSHVAGSKDSIVTDSVAGNLSGSGTVMDFEFTLTNPPPGMWTLRLQDTIAAGNYVPVLFQMTSDSALVAGLVGTGLDFPTSAPFSFGFVLVDTQSGLPPESVTVQASLQLNNQPTVTLNFHDDGLGHDQKANDGIYTATTQVSNPGDYTILVTAKGTWKGQPFTRTAAGLIHVSTPCITLNGTFQSVFQPGSGLVLSFDSNANAAMNVLLTAEITAANGNQASSSSFSDVRGGSNSLSVSFPMEWLTSLKANGPYTVSTVTAGCVDPQTLHAATSDRATNLGVTVPVNVGVTGPGLSISSTQLDFGTVNVTQTRDLKITVSNSAAAAINISSLTASGPFVVTGPSTPVAVPPGQGVDVTVRFSPSSAAPASGTLTILSADPVNPVLTVALKGTATSNSGPSLALSSPSISFGNVTVGQSSNRTFTISNSGTATLNVTSLNTAAPFSVVSPIAPFTVQAGATSTVTTSFAPTTIGLQTGKLTISSNDPANSSVNVSLTGSGQTAAAPPQISPGGVVNAADYVAKVSRGALAFAFGANLASQPSQAQSLPLQLALGGASVTVAGIPAPVFVVNPTFIEFQVPYEVPLGTSVPVVVTNNNVQSNTVNVTVADYAIGVFQYNRTSTIVDPDIFHTNGSLLTPTSPAVPGETVVAIANGIGKLNNPPRTGAAVSGPPYPTAVDLPAITIGGVPAVTQYAGLLASLLGVLQINIQLPANLPSGSLPLVIQSPGDSSPPVNVYVAGNLASAPKLSLSSNSLTFGNVTVGQTKDLSLAVSNTGSAALTVSSMTISGVGFNLVSPSTPFTVQPGGSQTVTVRCAPASAAILAGTVTISSNDANSQASISLSGTGVAAATPALGVNPTSLNFGTVTVGQTKDMTVALSNTGSGQLTVSALAASTGFLVTAPVAPVNIASGGSSTVTVRFVPTTATAVTGTLIITSNDPKNSTLIVSLSGTGATAGGQTKTVVLQVDGGTFNRVTGFGSTGQAGAAFVNRLTPSSYPATLQNVQIFFGNRANGLPINAPITVLYGANSSGTATISGNLSLLPAQILSLGTFSTYPVTPLTITSGDFIVGFRVDNAVGIYPADTDSTSPSQMRSYYAAGDFGFTLLDSVPGLAGNLAIRATATVPQ
jgi:uncharacterized protein (TIGR03437 family)